MPPGSSLPAAPKDGRVSGRRGLAARSGVSHGRVLVVLEGEGLGIEAGQGGRTRDPDGVLGVRLGDPVRSPGESWALYCQTMRPNRLTSGSRPGSGRSGRWRRAGRAAWPRPRRCRDRERWPAPCAPGTAVTLTLLGRWPKVWFWPLRRTSSRVASALSRDMDGARYFAAAVAAAPAPDS